MNAVHFDLLIVNALSVVASHLSHYVQERHQVFRARGVQVERLSICRRYPHSSSLYPSKKARICANLMGRHVGGWGGPEPWTTRPLPPL